MGALNETPLLGVLFDMDGTLVDSTEFIEFAWSSWARDLGVETPPLERRHGRPARDIIAEFAPPERFDYAFDRLEWWETRPDAPITPRPGVHDFIAQLGDIPWTVVTSATYPVALARLNAAGIPVPDTMVTARDVTRGKPDPEPFATGAARLGLDPATCFAVEDAEAGVRAAVGAGCVTLATSSIASERTLLTPLAHAVLPDLRGVRVDGDRTGFRILLPQG
ncbi:HAD family hydrolase [Mycetocola lacteus]|uniref:HAD family hydrolase n=1 Tax=Mycetocola lacteus TaxID=76637 RepID=A0A3L7AIR7_9MICO|nr:HAD-IA family hydrolase [Mycetocola lacteus]RLP79322.1 HAD family hydrolase [Mycetocola lacteus]